MEGNVETVQVPMLMDTMSFETRQSVGLKDMEKRVEADIKRKRKSWEKEVERMRNEFLMLYPTDRVWGSEELLNDPLVAKRRGSTDILDLKKMKTVFLDYPDVGRKFRIRFNVKGFERPSIQVLSDGDRIVVRATKKEVLPTNSNKEKQDESKEETKDDKKEKTETNTENTTATQETVLRTYERKIQKPKEVDATKFKCYLTSDHILIVEAPLRGRSSYHDLRRPRFLFYDVL